MKKGIFILIAVALAAISTGCEGGDVQEASVEVSPSTLELSVGNTGQLTASAMPSGATVVWSSSDGAIATVSQSGKVTAAAVGTATITAMAGGAKDTSVVTVVDNTGKAVELVEVSPANLNIPIGATERLSATVFPADATDIEVIWSSSDDDVATVAQDGTVTAVAIGSAIITATAGGGEGRCAITVGEAKPAVGDFFYSDGTYSSTLNADKTPIGIVFWAGNPAAEDPTLRVAHPQCTHGLVVSLDDATGDWQTNYVSYGEHISEWIAANTEYLSPAEADINAILGYNHTKAYEAFNAAPANSAHTVTIAERAAAYRESVPAPENTSDWYIPSLTEMALLCVGEFSDNVMYIHGTANRDIIMERLAMVEGAMPMDEHDYFWTSTENSMSLVGGVWCFKAYNGVAEATSGRKSPMNKNRYVLAF